MNKIIKIDIKVLSMCLLTTIKKNAISIQ
jgi:hypothetical protein